MRYRINGKLEIMQDQEQVQKEDVIIEIISLQNYQEEYEGYFHQQLLARSLKHTQHCKVDVLKESVIGTFAIPNKKNLMQNETTFGFYITKNKLLFIDENSNIEKMMTHFMKIQVFEKTVVAHFFFEFMEYLIKEDAIFLQEYEDKLEHLEEKLLNGEVEDFNKQILIIRKELLKINSYYLQLMDMSATLEENQNNLFSEADCKLFSLFENRVSRLYNSTQALKEYSLQLREMYQSQIDIKQNEIMKFLTIVTTVFMPLTLIAGWYGMNFVHMPELQAPYGYLIIIVISVIVVAAEIWYFKFQKKLK